jgi:GT2 family glycosyltransferase
MLLHDRATEHRICGALQEWSSANVSQARNSLTAKFVDDHKAADWLLWIDSDMAFDPNSLDALLAVADPERAPVVGGLCFGSDANGLFPTIYQMAALEDGRPVTTRMQDYPTDAMVQVAATGAAFLLIHRSVLVAIREHGFNGVFPWFQETELAGNPCGEDLTFCLRAGMCGFPVWVNTAVKVGHHKSQLLTEKLFREQREAS